MERCTKCLTESDKLELHHIGGESYKYCNLCASVINNINQPGKYFYFNQDDYGKLDISNESRGMIDARIRRAKGESIFKDHTWCGCPECGECNCKRCSEMNKNQIN